MISNSNQNIIRVDNNVSVVNYCDSTHPDTPEPEANTIKTFVLPVYENYPIFIGRESLFGAWIESGNEDEHFEEIYRSRLNSSTSIPIDDE